MIRFLTKIHFNLLESELFSKAQRGHKAKFLIIKSPGSMRIKSNPSTKHLMGAGALHLLPEQYKIIFLFPLLDHVSTNLSIGTSNKNPKETQRNVELFFISKRSWREIVLLVEYV